MDNVEKKGCYNTSKHYIKFTLINTHHYSFYKVVNVRF